MNARIVCLQCKAQRDAAIERCSTCGAEAFAYVQATRGDLTDAEEDVIEAAEILNDVLRRNVRITRSQPAAVRLAEVCRRLVFARAGFVGT